MTSPRIWWCGSAGRTPPAGILLPPLRGYAERVRRRVAAGPYPELVAQVRRPPRWSPVSNPLTDELANTMEFFIHHEDVRRARPGLAAPRPAGRPAGGAVEAGRPAGPAGAAPVPGRPARPGARATASSPSAGAASRLRLVGAPGELALFLSGRQRVARVQIDGPAAPADRLRTASLGI